MVKIVRSFPAPESLFEEAKKVTGRYDKPDVVVRLKKDFHNKCYICEMKELQDPEQYLTFQLREDRVVISEKQEGELYKRTATLITETFTLKNTGMRTYTSDERMRLLQKEMNILYKQLEKLHNSPGSKIIMRTICSLLRRESAFAAFKRCYVREHADEYPHLQKYLLDSEPI